MLKSWKLRLIIIAILSTGAGLFTLYSYVVNQCELRLDTQPSIDIPANAQILNISTTSPYTEAYSVFLTLLGAAKSKTVETSYVTESNYQDLISFYQHYGRCDSERELTRCEGEANPLGKYYVSIRHSLSNETNFSVRYYWEVCGNKI